MKRRFVSVAALASCAAFAQSSVNLFGLMDTALARGTGSIASTTQVVSSGLNTSRFGVRGSEDVGNGLAANFWLEAQLVTNTGAGVPTNTSNQGSGITPAGGLTFARRSTVGLSGAGFGELRLGRDYMPTFLAQADYDPFGATGIGATQSLLGATAPTAPFAANGGSTSVGVRASNSLGYLTPGFSSGVYGRVMTYRGNNPSGTAASEAGNGSSARIGWAHAGIDVSAAYARTKFATGDVTTATAGGSVIFGSGVKLSASFVRDRVASALPSGKGWLVGATVPVGAGQVLASFSSYRQDDAASSGARKAALGYVHNLSKRTALYAIGAKLFNEGASAQGLNGAQTRPGGRSNGLSLGVRHAF